ncbi:MAG: M48 family metallopeptidase, partial [Myxococcota bacterium]
MSETLSFRRYVADRQQNHLGGTDESQRYAYGADLAMIRTFKRLKYVELVVSAVVRSQKSLVNHTFMGRTVRVSARQLPRIHRIARDCAQRLGVAPPTIFVANNPTMNAYTFGTDDDSFIVVHSKLVDDFTDEELRFVIGHEMGHIQNRHVVYGTALQLLKNNAAVFIRWIAPPAEVALAAWARRAEITCDRAGLLCAGDVHVAERAFLKMACGSAKLYDELDVDAYLEQLEDGQSKLGRLSEMMATHPYLPKRIRALQLFAESKRFRSAAGLGDDGLDLKD